MWCALVMHETTHSHDLCFFSLSLSLTIVVLMMANKDFTKKGVLAVVVKKKGRDLGVHPRVERVLRDGARARLVRGSLARRNKVVLDLRDHSAVDVLRQLARPADVETRL